MFIRRKWTSNTHWFEHLSARHYQRHLYWPIGIEEDDRALFSDVISIEYNNKSSNDNVVEDGHIGDDCEILDILENMIAQPQDFHETNDFEPLELNETINEERYCKVLLNHSRELGGKEN